MRSSSRPRSPRFLPSQGALLGLLVTCWLPAAAHCGSIDGAWSLVPGFTPQVARARHAMLYDAVNRRAVVFCGLQGAARRNDVWVLPLDGAPAWGQLSPFGTPPTPRSDVAAIYDPVRGRMVVFGGDDGALQNEVWVLSLGSQRA